MNNIAYLSVGTNMGDRFANLQTAVRKLADLEQIRIEAVSSVYETDPVGYTDQALFLNIAVKLSTSLSAAELLERCLGIERRLGRVREFRWGPRVIDLDIILYNKDNIETEVLTVPHPRMQERAFVLVPLLEIEPALSLPGKHTPLIEVLNEIPDKEGVRLWKQINGEGAYALLEN